MKSDDENWILDRVASVIGLVTDLSIVADKMKVKWDDYVEFGNDRYPQWTANEWKLLTHFGDLDVVKTKKLGRNVFTYSQGVTHAVHRIQEVLDDVYRLLRKDIEPIVTIQCEHNGADNPIRGNADVLVNPLNKKDVWPVRKGSGVSINCDSFSAKEPLEFEGTLLHELTHFASYTDDEATEGHENHANKYQSLVGLFK